MIESSDKQVLQKNLSQFLVKDVFNLITEEDVLTIKGKDWIFGGRKLDGTEVATLKSEAKVLAQMQLWKFLNNRKRQIAQNALIKTGKTDEDIIANRMILYLLDVDETIIASIGE